MCGSASTGAPAAGAGTLVAGSRVLPARNCLGSSAGRRGLLTGCWQNLCTPAFSEQLRLRLYRYPAARERRGARRRTWARDQPAKPCSAFASRRAQWHPDHPPIARARHNCFTIAQQPAKPAPAAATTALVSCADGPGTDMWGQRPVLVWNLLEGQVGASSGGRRMCAHPKQAGSSWPSRSVPACGVASMVRYARHLGSAE
jgi:hypothetical protein